EHVLHGLINEGHFDYTEVFCVVMESCILPCSFQGDTDVVIHWIQVTAGNSPVHSFYHNKDQLTHQDQRFSGRTSLFTDQISGGNASLQLTGLQVQDQGRYKCYTSTNRGRNESFTNLKVDGEKHSKYRKYKTKRFFTGLVAAILKVRNNVLPTFFNLFPVCTDVFFIFGQITTLRSTETEQESQTMAKYKCK
uniref:Ig-like domain-containing protein n=1 Tax=Seriola dumerili TaxID=41447 RepID=A0A3B4VP36_SERDU